MTSSNGEMPIKKLNWDKKSADNLKNERKQSNLKKRFGVRRNTKSNRFVSTLHVQKPCSGSFKNFDLVNKEYKLRVTSTKAKKIGRINDAWDCETKEERKYTKCMGRIYLVFFE